MSFDALQLMVNFAGSAIGILAGIIGANKLTDYRLREIETKINAMNEKIEAYHAIETRLSIIETVLNMKGVQNEC